MKNAQEWMEQSNDPQHWITSNRFDESFIKEIQIDAMKEGMRVAIQSVRIAGGDNEDYHVKAIEQDMDSLTPTES